MLTGCAPAGPKVYAVELHSTIFDGATHTYRCKIDGKSHVLMFSPLPMREPELIAFEGDDTGPDGETLDLGGKIVTRLIEHLEHRRAAQTSDGDLDRFYWQLRLERFVLSEPALYAERQRMVAAWDDLENQAEDVGVDQSALEQEAYAIRDRWIAWFIYTNQRFMLKEPNYAETEMYQELIELWRRKVASGQEEELS